MLGCVMREMTSHARNDITDRALMQHSDKAATTRTMCTDISITDCRCAHKATAQLFRFCSLLKVTLRHALAPHTLNNNDAVLHERA